MKRAPIPLGAPNLWPEMVRKSNCCFCASIRTFPNAWTASVWKERAALLRLRRELRHRLDRADLVVDPHYRADGNRVVNEIVERFPVDHAIGCHGENALFGAFTRGLVHRTKNRLVLDGAGYDSCSSLRLERAPGPEDGEIVALGAAGCETDLVRTRA